MATLILKNNKALEKAPKLRFSEFSREWKDKTLGSIAQFSKGKGISKSDIVENGDLECIRYGELYTTYDEVINNVTSRTNIDPEDLVLSEVNDVIIPASGETQIDIATASCVLNSGVALGGDLNIIKTPMNGVFLSYYLNNRKKKDIARLSQGISVVHLYSHQLKILTLFLPDEPEQQKIASFLSAIDKKIQQLTRKKKLLEQYKKGVMQKLFSQEIRFKRENGKDYPDWEEKRLGKIFDNYGGTALEQYVNEKGHYKFISIGNYSKGGNYIDNKQRIALNEKTNAKLLHHHELVMVLNDKTKTGDIIGSTILIDEDDAYIYNQRSERLVCDTYILPQFAWLYLNSSSFRKEVFSISQGGTQIYVNFSAVKKIKIQLPSISEQEKIAIFLLSINDKIEVLQNQLTQTQQFKKGLLQQMFV